MLISLTVIKKPRKVRRCASLVCTSKTITGQQVRCYGAACGGDKPYVIHLHPECAMQWPDAKKKMATI